ncbi:DUF3050 domain-containing protein [Collimonas pratensis]|uniref:DUF3050 domain-containing protein n=1 Tax=Collimonas pratensis TaxID=279113 RepID=A0A127QB11_9BURK|nr:DUF3050 domain-containing protein [Collimonas pratensis]AMP06802.1 hypothetical protein CPter91_4495 [Collimonas pratensis]
MTTTIESLQLTLKEKHNLLTNHAVFSAIRNQDDLRLFMEWHVFAVWDFMSLVKRLQMDLTTTSIPWYPPANPNAARLINEIVLGEESDITPKGAMTHFDLYLSAMKEIGASTRQINQFLNMIRKGDAVATALKRAEALAPIQRFVSATISTCQDGLTHQVVGSFFYGRENVIPEMFQALLKSWSIAPETVPELNFYLERHIEVDSGDHGPAAQRMIEEITGNDPVQMREVLEAGIQAIDERHRLWDSLLVALQHSPS